MTETQSDPRTEPLTDAQLDNLELAARASFGEDERSQGLINGVLSLIVEVRRLRHDDAIWEKHGLVQIVTERNELRDEVNRLRSLLETEQRAKWAAEQDKQHWQEEAERLRLQVAQLAEALEIAIGSGGEDDSNWYAVTLHNILQALTEREVVK